MGHCDRQYQSIFYIQQAVNGFLDAVFWFISFAQVDITEVENVINNTHIYFFREFTALIMPLCNEVIFKWLCKTTTPENK